MRVLLDHNFPRTLQRHLVGHTVATAGSRGWAELANGDLLGAAASEFDVLLTLDRSLRHQQHIAAFEIAVIVVRARSNRVSDLLPLIPPLLVTIGLAQPRRVYIVE